MHRIGSTVLAGILPPVIRILRREFIELYPELATFATAMRGRDWPRLRNLFEELPAGSDPALAMVVATEVSRSERFLRDVVAAEPDDMLPRVLLGARYIHMAWQARTPSSPQFVSKVQFATFHELLDQAEHVLTEVNHSDPGNAAAWSFRITTARGLQLGVPEARRRYEIVAAVGSGYFYAQQTMLQQLCPKWGGTLDSVHAFARECMIAAGPGTLSGSLVAAGMIEHSFTLGKPERQTYLRAPHIVPQLEAAATWSVMNPGFVEAPGWLWAHNVFAYMWVVAGLPARGAVHFDIADRRAGKYPWDSLADPMESYLSIRKRAMSAK